MNTVLIAGALLAAIADLQDPALSRIGMPSRESDPTTLQWAAAHGQVSLVQMLLKVGFDVNAKGSNGNRPL